jgi:hypothetical protein
MRREICQQFNASQNRIALTGLSAKRKKRKTILDKDSIATPEITLPLLPLAVVVLLAENPAKRIKSGVGYHFCSYIVDLLQQIVRAYSIVVCF